MRLPIFSATIAIRRLATLPTHDYVSPHRVPPRRLYRCRDSKRRAALLSSSSHVESLRFRHCHYAMPDALGHADYAKNMTRRRLDDGAILVCRVTICLMPQTRELFPPFSPGAGALSYRRKLEYRHTMTSFAGICRDGFRDSSNTS